MNYSEVTIKDIEFLVALCGAERVYSGEAINEDYCHDELGGINRRPDVMVEVLTTAEVTQIMKYAHSRNIPVTPRGQGTGLVGGSVTLHNGIMLNMCKMNRILELDEDNFTLTVEPGVLLMEISAFVESKNLFYPPDPGEKSATIGGNINTNAGGMRAVKYGVTRDYVRGLELVLADGTVMQVGGKIVKNSSGYSLKDMIVGSEGTLAVVTKAVLRLLPLPKKVISLLIPFPELQMAIDMVPQIIRSGSVPTAIEFMERDVILAAEEFLGRKFPDNSADAYLLLSFDGGSVAEIEADYEVVAHACLAAGAIDVFIANTDERKDSIWSARGAFLEAIKSSTTEMDECDVVVPRQNVASFIKYTRELQEQFDIRIRSFGHAGDGNLHVYVLRDDLEQEVWDKKLTDVFECMYSRAHEFGGQVSGEHGIGYAKRQYLKDSIGDAGIDLMQRIKLAFDPKNIINPGKIAFI